jgi:hypothetical protein
VKEEEQPQAAGLWKVAQARPKRLRCDDSPGHEAEAATDTENGEQMHQELPSGRQFIVAERPSSVAGAKHEGTPLVLDNPKSNAAPPRPAATLLSAWLYSPTGSSGMNSNY